MRVLRWLLLGVLVVGGIWYWRSSTQPTVLGPDDPRLVTGDTKIVMLAAEWCGYCKKLRAEFDRKGVRYQVLDVEKDAGRKAADALDAEGVPVTVIGQQVVQGYDTETIKSALKPLGYEVF